jgi:hypothetical protein
MVAANNDNWYNFVVSDVTGHRYNALKIYGSEFTKFAAMMQILGYLDKKYFQIGNAIRGAFIAPRIMIIPREELDTSIWKHPQMTIDENGLPKNSGADRDRMHHPEVYCEDTVHIAMSYTLQIPFSHTSAEFPSENWEKMDFDEILTSMLLVLNSTTTSVEFGPQYGAPSVDLGLSGKINIALLRIDSTILVPLGRSEIEITTANFGEGMSEGVEIDIELTMYNVPYTMDAEGVDVQGMVKAFVATASSIEHYVDKLGPEIELEYETPEF